MSAQRTAPQATTRSPADRAYRRAWWSLALYPVSFVLAFVTGEGLLSLVAEDPEDPVFWEVVAAGVPAIIVFVLPGVLAVWLGRTAVRLGRQDGNVPALIGAAIGIGFVGLNVVSGLAMVLLG